MHCTALHCTVPLLIELYCHTLHRIAQLYLHCSASSQSSSLSECGRISVNSHLSPLWEPSSGPYCSLTWSGALPVTTCNYLQLRTTTYSYLQLRSTTFNYLQLRSTTFNYLQLPATTCNYLQLPATTCKYLQLPETTCNYLQLPVTTCNYLTCVSSRHSRKCVTLLKLKTELKTNCSILGIFLKNNIKLP